LANTRSAEKRNRQTQKRRLRNQAVRTRVKSAVRKVRESLERGEGTEAKTAFAAASRLLDQAAAKGVLHRNTASRRISRLAKAVGKPAPAK
jgi:small subunit ribosomal protein S20